MAGKTIMVKEGEDWKIEHIRNYYSRSTASRIFNQIEDSGSRNCIDFLFGTSRDYQHYNLRNNPHLAKSAPWTPLISRLIKKISDDAKWNFNAILANRYSTMEHGVMWHSDEFEIVPGSTIASLSLGQTGHLGIRSYTTEEEYVIELRAGDLLIMSGNFQKHFEHRVYNAIGAIKKPRISLIFRQYKEYIDYYG